MIYVHFIFNLSNVVTFEIFKSLWKVKVQWNKSWWTFKSLCQCAFLNDMHFKLVLVLLFYNSKDVCFVNYSTFLLLYNMSYNIYVYILFWSSNMIHMYKLLKVNMKGYMSIWCKCNLWLSYMLRMYLGLCQMCIP